MPVDSLCLRFLQTVPSSQSTITTESQWRPLSEAERLSIGEADDLSQIRKRREEYAGFKERYNRLKRKDVEPAAIDDFSFRRRRDTRHRSQQDFDDTLSVHTYNSDTNFTEFSSYKPPPPTSRFDRMRDTELSPNMARFFEGRFDRTRDTEYYIGARYETRVSVTNNEVPLKQIASSQSQFDRTHDADHTGVPYKPRLSIGNNIEEPSSPPKQSVRLQDNDVLLPSQDPLPPTMTSSAASKQSSQKPSARPDIKGKGRMIRPSSPADKGQDRPTHTSPLHQQSPPQQFADDNIDDFEYDYGDDHLSIRSSRQPDARQHDVIKKVEQDLNSLDNNMIDDPFKE
ncbi:hypothetical protein BJV82DRAFT_407464 [Fennellomyces sp. T-0311]|nr:hypothetical protein BJV82DRAFT_407464 [Fennellomyces sp. T-0311]